MTQSSIGGMRPDYSARLDNSSFLGASKLNYGGDDFIGHDEKSQKVQRLLEKVRKMTAANNTKVSGFGSKRV